MTENICVTKYHCQAACCHNTRLLLSTAEFDQYFIDSHPTPCTSTATLHQKGLKAMQLVAVGLLKRKVFYSVDADKSVWAIIAGPCPHLDQHTFNCRIYEYRPSACKKVPINGQTCQSARKDG